MAFLFFNKTVCKICSSVIKEEDQYYSFPSFVVNIRDPVYYFNDQTFHINCLNSNPHSENAIGYSKHFLDKIKPGNRICIIGKNLITDYKYHIFIDLLTSNLNDSLHQYNFVHIDKRNLINWHKRDHLIKALVNLKEDNNWQEINSEKIYLNTLINNLTVN
jgi:hypothetical protein